MSVRPDLLPDAVTVATRRRRPIRTALLGLVICGLLLTMVLGGTLAYFEHRLSENITRTTGAFDGLDHRPTRPAGRAGDAVNVLVIATDRRVDYAATDRDAVLVLHIDADRRAATIVSIPLTTWVDVPGRGQHEMGTAVSAVAPSLAVATVESLTSVRIDHLAVIEWSGIAELVDSIGGIRVAASENRLDGRQALEFVRRRDSLAFGDLDQVARQQVVLRTLMEDTLHQEMRKDPRMLYRFLDTVSNHLAVEEKWSSRDMLRLMFSMRSLHTADLSYLTMPVSGLGTEDGRTVVYADRRDSRALWEAVRADRVAEWKIQHRDALSAPPAN